MFCTCALLLFIQLKLYSCYRIRKMYLKRTFVINIYYIEGFTYEYTCRDFYEYLPTMCQRQTRVYVKKSVICEKLRLAKRAQSEKELATRFELAS
jgi:hypothetical protein